MLDDLQDLPFIYIVGFLHSLVFKMQRPHYPKYPRYTLNHFKLQIIKAFLSNATIFILEDLYNLSKEEKFPKAFSQKCLRAKTNSKVIISVAIITGLK